MHIPAVRSEITKQELRYKGAFLYNRINKTNNLTAISVHNLKKEHFFKLFLIFLYRDF